MKCPLGDDIRNKCYLTHISLDDVAIFSSLIKIVTSSIIEVNEKFKTVIPAKK